MFSSSSSTLLPLLLAAATAATAAPTCAPIMLIFARGTTEPSPLGTVVGPPFQSALESRLPGQVSVQGVPAPAYPADVAGFLAGGSASGTAAMLAMVKEAASACPDARVVLSGYSQGGQLVHNVGEQLDAATAARVAGAVIFGDPDNPDPVANVPNLKVFCAQGDLICSGQAIVLAPHLSYGADAGEAADYVASIAA